jgi:DNA-binding NtrC family response regulator/pSer/pThr/pTyr-binding forkhead associated (FHA) protein
LVSGDGQAQPPRKKTAPDAQLGALDVTSDLFYLLVFERNSSWVFRLPETGEVLVGRADAADLRIEDPSASRMHAKIVLIGGEARVADLKSQNGTFVNGERVTSPRVLSSGDTIAISGTTLVFHSGMRPQISPVLVEMDQLRRRAQEEVERSLRSHRPFSLLVIDLGVDCTDRQRTAVAVTEHLRSIDLASWDGASEVSVLLPEAGAEGGQAVAERLVEGLAEVAPAARAGFASWPNDGGDVDSLLVSARAASQAAKPRGVTSAARTFQVVKVGDRKAIIADPAMVRLFALINRLAQADMPVLVCGETGVGKELAAVALHHWSRRRERPLVSLNCATIPEQLVESELFGYEKGAFSGAGTSKQGLIEAADRGTLLLDEVGELPSPAQAKLLRVLETKRLRPLGDVREREIDVRIVTATNRDMEDEVKTGRFRKDLYFRLRGATIWIPPLRDRRSELAILAKVFLDQACASLERTPMEIAAEAMEELAAYSWPGNVRELQSFIDYVAAVAKGSVIEGGSLADWLGRSATVPVSAEVPALFRPIKEELRELERARMAAALAAAGGNQTRAAELIGMPIRTFMAKVKVYALQGSLPPRGPEKPRTSS